MEKEYPASISGFNTNAEMQRVTELVMEAIESSLSVSEFDTLHITNRPEESIIQIDFNYGVGCGKTKLIVIELWADHNLEIPECDTKLYWDIVDMIANLREQLINGDFDFAFSKEVA